MLGNLRARSRSATRLWLAPILFAAILSGCATGQTPQPLPCEQAPLPRTLTAPSSPDAESYSQKVRTWSEQAESWLRKVQDFSQE